MALPEELCIVSGIRLNPLSSEFPFLRITSPIYIEENILFAKPLMRGFEGLRSSSSLLTLNQGSLQAGGWLGAAGSGDRRLFFCRGW